MCGIAGTISCGNAKRASDLVAELVKGQRHRGPDAEAVVAYSAEGASVVLGHNRLSIIDLSSDANQPMTDSSRRIHIVFNGEIYNYIELKQELADAGVSFRTHSDTEVLLEAYKRWGRDCLTRCNGMFAFALYDENDRSVWLVRDRFGVKPLYYCREKDRISFASEGRTLARCFSCGPNLEFVSRGIKTWVFDDDSADCQYEGLDMLPSGCWALLTWRDGACQVEVQRWYDVHDRAFALREKLAGRRDRDLIADINETLDSAVEIRLRSDVPIALSLSGGLDSTTICSILAKQDRRLEAFTYGSIDDDETEGPVVDKVCKALQVKVHYIRPDSSNVLDAYLRTIEGQDAPFVSGAQVAHYLICEQVAQNGFKVVLGGQGGDEAFMGYRKYFPFCTKEALQNKRIFDLVRFGSSLANMMWQERRHAGIYWKHRKRFGETFEETRLELPPPKEGFYLGLKSGQAAWERQALDVTRFSLPTLLRYEDRNSMAHSLEGRLPFLDYRLIELGLALPNELKLRNGWGKWALREATKGLVPEFVRTAKFKVGFSTRQPKWVRDGLGGLMRDRLRHNPSAANSYLRAGLTIDRAFSDEALIQDKSAMPEMISLLWLSGLTAQKPLAASRSA